MDLTDANRQSILNMMKERYQNEGCGVCEKPGAEVVWFNPISHCAHSVCFEEIKNVETNLYVTIYELFQDNGTRNKVLLLKL